MVYEYLLKTAKAKGSAFLVLMDPDRQSAAEAARMAKQYAAVGVDGILFGTSLLLSDRTDRAIRAIKRNFKKPVIIFPGSAYQVSRHADAILYLSLISGRNASLLIDEQVKAAPMVKQARLEAIPTGYMLVESGRPTAASYMSHSLPIPSDKPDIAKAHALAARYLGMELIYMDAGSGALNPVPDRMITEVFRYAGLPVVVGGGIRTPEQAAQKARAGACAVVVGNALERRGGGQAAEFARAIHYK